MTMEPSPKVTFEDTDRGVRVLVALQTAKQQRKYVIKSFTLGPHNAAGTPKVILGLKPGETQTVRLFVPSISAREARQLKWQMERFTEWEDGVRFESTCLGYPTESNSSIPSRS